MLAKAVRSVATHHNIIHSSTVERFIVAVETFIKTFCGTSCTSSSLRSWDTVPRERLVSRLSGCLPSRTFRRAPPYAVSFTAVYG